MRHAVWVLLAALLFSTGGAAIKAAAVFEGWHLAFLRSAIAGVVLLLCVPRARRVPQPPVWLVCGCFAFTLVVFVLANRLTTAANAIFLQSTAPLWVVLVAPLLLGEPGRRTDLPVVGLLLAGIGLLVGSEEPATALATQPSVGDALAALCGLTWGLTVIGMRWMARDGSTGALTVAAWGSVLAALAALPFAWPLPVAGWSDWAAAAWLGVVQVSAAYVLLARGLPKLGALEAMLLLMVEPLLVPVWAFLLHGERPTGWALVGGGVVLTAVAFRGAAPPPRPASVAAGARG